MFLEHPSNASRLHRRSQRACHGARSQHSGHLPVLPARLWMRIALLGGTVLLVLLLVQVPHPYEPAAMGGGTLPAAPYLSLSSADGIAYASSPDGMVWAMRVRDGFLLWSRTLPSDAPPPVHLTLVNRIIYLRAEVEQIDALRASDGSVLWYATFSAALPTTSCVPKRALGSWMLRQKKRQQHWPYDHQASETKRPQHRARLYDHPILLPDR